MRQSQFTEILLSTQINFGHSWPKKTKKRNQLKKILIKKEMPESSAWAKNYKFNHSIFFKFFPKRTSDSLVVEVHQNLRAEVAGGTGGISWRGRDIRLVPWGFPRRAQEKGETRSVLTKTFPVLPKFCMSLIPGPKEAGVLGIHR